MPRIAGYDIGGAHLKVAVAVDGCLVEACQIPSPLSRGTAELVTALEAAARITRGCDAHRITMTGELADVFPDRFTGVARILELAAAQIGAPERTYVWMGALGFGSVEEAWENHAEVASANFLATAALVAERLPDRRGLLVDMGSTTTDVVAFRDGKPLPVATTDAGRLASGELVYTGLTRTPVMSITARGLFAGRVQTLARDPFATMGDVYTILGRLPGGVDRERTADGRGPTVEESCARLARCFGHDVEPGREHLWMPSARHIAEAQALSLVEGCCQVLSGRPEHGSLIVAAGIGSGIVADIARRLGAASIPFCDVAGITGDFAMAATHFAPAASLALLRWP